MATYGQISNWLNKYKHDKDVSHVLIIFSEYDCEYYPRAVRRNQDIDKMIADCRNNMEIVREIYNMDMPIEFQLYSDKAWNI